jgi:hypothetical protein
VVNPDQSRLVFPKKPSQPLGNTAAGPVLTLAWCWRNFLGGGCTVSLIDTQTLQPRCWGLGPRVVDVYVAVEESHGY